VLQHGKCTRDMQCSQGLSPSSGLQLVLLLLPFTQGHWDRLRGPGGEGSPRWQLGVLPACKVKIEVWSQNVACCQRLGLGREGAGAEAAWPRKELRTTTATTGAGSHSLQSPSPAQTPAWHQVPPQPLPCPCGAAAAAGGIL